MADDSVLSDIDEVCEDSWTRFKVELRNIQDECILLQFTGLTDRNGVDIYEGDLIKNQRGRTAEVVWHKFTASFDSIFVSDDDSAPIALDKSYGFHNADWKHEVEVIGNIYQNPELIEMNNK